MRVWLGIVTGGLLLLGLWGLPPRTESEWLRGPRLARPERTTEWEVHSKIQSDVRRRHWVYQRLQWVDSLERVIRASRGIGNLQLVSLPDTAPEHYLPRLQEAVALQLAHRGVPEPKVTVGAVLLDANLGLHSLAQRADPMSSYGRELFVSRDPEAPYCIVVDPLYPSSRHLRSDWARMVWMSPDSSVGPNPLGPCALYGKFGMPGPEISKWLSQTEHVFGKGGRGAWESAFYPEHGVSRGPFGLRNRWYTYSPSGEACLAGDWEGCARALSEGPASRSYWRTGQTYGSGRASPVLIQTLEVSFYPLFGGRESDLLWDLQEEYGPERFQAFWESELGVDEAFQAAFGISFPDWTMSWAQGGVGVLGAGPAVPPGATLLAFLTIAGLVALALFRGRRWS
jgi:hypothetical protein